MLAAALGNKDNNASLTDTDSEGEACWICLDDSTTNGHHLFSPCQCPRRVHPKCLARWQLQQAGRPEETHCRFCNSTLADWKASLTPDNLKPDVKKVQPIMVVYFEGEIHRIPVKQGPDGLSDFTSRIRELFRLPDEVDISLTFGCKEPMSGQHLKLEGIGAFDAAVHCASVAAADRQSKLRTGADATSAGGTPLPEALLLAHPIGPPLAVDYAAEFAADEEDFEISPLQRSLRAMANQQLMVTQDPFAYSPPALQSPGTDSGLSSEVSEPDSPTPRYPAHARVSPPPRATVFDITLAVAPVHTSGRRSRNSHPLHSSGSSGEIFAPGTPPSNISNHPRTRALSSFARTHPGAPLDYAGSNSSSSAASYSRSLPPAEPPIPRTHATPLSLAVPLPAALVLDPRSARRMRRDMTRVGEPELVSHHQLQYHPSHHVPHPSHHVPHPSHHVSRPSHHVPLAPHDIRHPSRDFPPPAQDVPRPSHLLSKSYSTPTPRTRHSGGGSGGGGRRSGEGSVEPSLTRRLKTGFKALGRKVVRGLKLGADGQGSDSDDDVQPPIRGLANMRC